MAELDDEVSVLCFVDARPHRLRERHQHRRYEGGDVREDELLMSISRDRQAPFSADDSPLRVNQMRGPQFALPQLVRATLFRDEGDYRHYLARLQAMPEQLRQLQIQLDAGRAAGWMRKSWSRPPIRALAPRSSGWATA